MPTSLHQRHGADATHETERERHRAPDRDESTEHDRLVRHANGTAHGHAEALRRVDPAARASLITTLQRTFGNGRVQRLLAGLAQRSSEIDRCGGMPCHGGQEEEGVRRVRRLGQTPEEIKAPRSATLASPAVPQRRDEEESRPHAHH